MSVDWVTHYFHPMMCGYSFYANFPIKKFTLCFLDYNTFYKKLGLPLHVGSLCPSTNWKLTFDFPTRWGRHLPLYLCELMNEKFPQCWKGQGGKISQTFAWPLTLWTFICGAMLKHTIRVKTFSTTTTPSAEDDDVECVYILHIQ